MIAAHQVNDSASLQTAIEVDVDQIQALSIDALRKRWRTMFGATPPRALSKDIIARLIAYRVEEEAFGGLDRETIKLLDRLARGEQPGELNRRLKVGTVLIREYEGKRHTVTVATDGFLWEEKTYSSSFRRLRRSSPARNGTGRGFFLDFATLGRIKPNWPPQK